MTISCETCGKPSSYNGRCDWCWNVEHLLDAAIIACAVAAWGYGAYMLARVFHFVRRDK